MCSVAELCPTVCDPMDRSTPGFPVLHHLPEFAQTHVHGVGDAIQPSHPLSSPSPPALNLSQHRVFSNESALRVKWPKYWHFSFSISSSQYSGFISFRMVWFDSLVVQGTLKSLHQWHNSKASIICGSSCFMVQPLHLYMTTGSFQPFIASSYLISYLSCINLLLNPRDINQAWFLSL